MRNQSYENAKGLLLVMVVVFVIGLVVAIKLDPGEPNTVLNEQEKTDD